MEAEVLSSEVTMVLTALGFHRADRIVQLWRGVDFLKEHRDARIETADTL